MRPSAHTCGRLSRGTGEMFINNEKRRGLLRPLGALELLPYPVQPCGLLRYSLPPTLGIFDISPAALSWLSGRILNNLPWEVREGRNNGSSAFFEMSWTILEKNACHFQLVTSFKTLPSPRLYCCFKVLVTFIFCL